MIGNFNFYFVIFQVYQPVHNVLHLHHLDRAHPSEVVSQLRQHARVESEPLCSHSCTLLLCSTLLQAGQTGSVCVSSGTALPGQKGQAVLEQLVEGRQSWRGGALTTTDILSHYKTVPNPHL